MRGDTHPVSHTDHTYLPFGSQCVQNIASKPRCLDTSGVPIGWKPVMPSHMFSFQEMCVLPDYMLLLKLPIWVLLFPPSPYMNINNPLRSVYKGKELIFSRWGLNLRILTRKKQQHIFTYILADLLYKPHIFYCPSSADICSVDFYTYFLPVFHMHWSKWWSARWI
jgi:hypothetical protein